ncbi:heterokaryon incompatibility protein-domain-containing protein [Rhypophila decipiens]|uniref:Heterokaryon incompatibility protein-domain-containing protein n=1 Tax=Rhypophila decipiens TaxID=261697 RepID=A0AAN6YGK3_9PEZI|nr:heterokaryon incompatibility protein-domain-containing protein [Rhypophila decipiens]
MVGSHVNWTWSTAGKKKLKQQCRKVLVGSHVNWSLGWRWLDDCLENHGAFCTRERAGSLPVGFRLIDVDRRCVVETQANSRHEFVALSYVWGQQTDPTRLFATKSNRERLKIDGSLSVLDLPKTVEDAIEACRQLGEVYLWVDRFCIVQDDLEDKARQISAMATIYSLAKFALIITDGDSDSGIAGISRERTQGQMCEQIAGFDFISDPTQWREIIGGASVWSTRGWTYQEAILPQRKLYLSESQAFFECATEVVHERGEIEQGMYSPHGLNTFPWNPRYVTFYSHLKKYRKRSLTNRADVYNAIDGIASALYGCSQALLSGLPRQEFDEALLWCLDAHNDENPQGPAFNGSSPSWSWSSTDRELILLDDTNRMPIDYCDTLTAWNRISHDGKYVESVRTMPAGKPLSHFQENQDSCSCCRDWWFNAKRDAERLLFSVLAWSQGCINRPCPFAQPHETTWAAMRAEIRARWSCRHRYWLEALQDVTISSPSPSMPSASTVFASVQSASFRLQGSVQRVEPSQRPFNDLRIAHPDGQLAGLLVVGDPGLGLGPEIIAKSKFEFIALSIGTSSSIVLPDGQIKLIFKWDMALHCEDEPGVAASQPLDQDTQAQPESEPDSSNTPECQWDPDKYRRCHPTSLSVEELQKLTFRDGAGKLLCPLPVVNVMMVERTGENSVRRISVGWIYLTSWIRAEPKFVTVFLE